ncbi:unnamed protein product [Blepharisma stoltei]|uniref:Uncharacterized protein n=1 Tax=Blepharisma stoltei TaxID=1481888 RepID=A0AAU9JCM2_9CILI|nr:unnamed protein product [Blepharisma stoltei]
MDNQVTLRFFQSCAPDFFSKELTNIISRWNQIPESTSIISFLSTLDSLIDLISENGVPVNLILPTTFRPLLLEEFRFLSSTQLKFQLILHLELLRVDKSPELIHKLGRIGRSLCMRMAIDGDSSTFYRYYISDILPRYSSVIFHEALLEFSQTIELYQETLEFLDEIKPQNDNEKSEDLPQKRMISPPKQRHENQKHLTKESKFIDRKLNTNRTKEVAFSRRIVLKESPNRSPRDSQPKLSAAALKMKELLGKNFYKRNDTEKKEISECNEKKTEKKNDDVLILDTPTKNEK